MDLAGTFECGRASVFGAEDSMAVGDVILVSVCDSM